MPESTIRVLTTSGVQFVEGLDPRERSIVAAHWNAVRDFLERGDTQALQRFQAELLSTDQSKFGDVELCFELDVIEREAFRDLQFESIYES